MASRGSRQYQQKVVLEEGHARGITAVAFSRDGMYLATAGLDGRVCIWNADSGKLLHKYVGSSAVLSLAWVPSGEEALLFGSQDGNIGLLSVSLALNDFSMTGFWAHKYPVEHLAAFGDYAASGAHEELKVWQWLPLDQRFSLAHAFPLPPKTSYNQHAEVLVTSLHWTGVSGHPLLMVTYMYHAIQLYEVPSWRSIRSISLQGKIARASLSPDGSLLAVSNLVRGFDIYRTDTQEPVGIVPQKIGTQQPTPVLFIHGGNAIVCGSTTGTLQLWDVEVGKLHNIVIPNQARVLALATHSQPMPDGIPYRFRIATGIYNENAPSSCIIWEAQQLNDAFHAQLEAGDSASGGDNAHPPSSGARTGFVRSLLINLLKLLVTLGFIVAVAYVMVSIPVEFHEL